MRWIFLLALLALPPWTRAQENVSWLWGARAASPPLRPTVSWVESDHGALSGGSVFTALEGGGAVQSAVVVEHVGGTPSMLLKLLGLPFRLDRFELLLDGRDSLQGWEACKGRLGEPGCPFEANRSSVVFAAELTAVDLDRLSRGGALHLTLNGRSPGDEAVETTMILETDSLVPLLAAARERWRHFSDEHPEREERKRLLRSDPRLPAEIRRELEEEEARRQAIAELAMDAVPIPPKETPLSADEAMLESIRRSAAVSGPRRAPR